MAETISVAEGSLAWARARIAARPPGSTRYGTRDSLATGISTVHAAEGYGLAAVAVITLILVFADEGEDKAGRMIVMSDHWRTRPMQARASAQQSRNSVAAVLDRSHSQKGGSLREGTSGEPRE